MPSGVLLGFGRAKHTILRRYPPPQPVPSGVVFDQPAESMAGKRCWIISSRENRSKTSLKVFRRQVVSRASRSLNSLLVSAVRSGIQNKQPITARRELHAIDVHRD